MPVIAIMINVINNYVFTSNYHFNGNDTSDLLLC